MSVVNAGCAKAQQHAPFTQDDRDSYATAFDRLKSIRSGNPLKQFFEEGKDISLLVDDYVIGLIDVAIIWMVFLGIGILVYGLLAINMCCMRIKCC